MEKISLYDKENDQIYDIMLSPEDARRAASDLIFATNLLNVAILEKNKTEQNEISKTLNTDNNTQSAIIPGDSNIHNDIQSIDSCEENYLFRWPEACVLLLLRTYEEMEEKFTSGKFPHKRCWELVAHVLKDRGYNITGPQCASKFRGLKKTYKSIKDHNAKSGNDRRTWQYFEVMENMFSKKAWCQPVALASSTGLSLKNINTKVSSATSSQLYSDSDTEKENDPLETGRKIAKATKTSVAQLLEKRLAQKEEHECKRQKRHDDRMLVETKLIDTLTQLLNK